LAVAVLLLCCLILFCCLRRRRNERKEAESQINGLELSGGLVADMVTLKDGDQLHNVLRSAGHVSEYFENPIYTNESATQHENPLYDPIGAGESANPPEYATVGRQAHPAVAAAAADKNETDWV